MSFLKEQPDGVLLSVKVQPRAGKNEIEPVQGAELKIKVTAPPVNAAANEAVLRLLAETLDCPCGMVQLVRGGTSRHKTILLRGMKRAAVADRLKGT